LRPRYQAISEHLRQAQRAFMVEFCYLDEGICIRGQWFPIVKMRWVEGFTLNDFICQQLDKPVLLERLGQMWLRLGQELRDARMAHGDLQHGNVLLAPGSKSGSLALKLIDYDGMFVPALSETPSDEVGHPNYQHPRRLREGGYDREMDRFSHLLIYTALRGLRIGGVELWRRYDNQENLLFREEDFRQPGQSRLLRELWHGKDRDVRDLVGRLLLASQGPLPDVPALDELVDEKVVRPLTGKEEARVHALLDAAPGAARKPRTHVAMDALSPLGAPSVEAGTASLALLETKEMGAATLGAADQASPARAKPPPLPRGILPAPLSGATRIGLGTLTLDGQAAGEHSSEVSPRLERIVSLLSRPVVLIVLGALGSIGFLLVNLMVWSFAKQPPAAAPSARTARLLSIPDVPLKGGYKKEVELLIERNDCDDPLTLQVDGLPAEMTVPALNLPAEEEKIALPLLAPLNFDLPARDVFVSLWQGGRRIDEQRFRLSVSRVARPLLHSPDPLHCRAGESLVFTGQVERRDCREPLTLRFMGLPAGVGQESLPAEANEMPRVKLFVAPDARPQDSVPVNLTLRVGDVIADTKPLPLIVDKAVPRVRLKKEGAIDALSIRANGNAELTVHIDRADYQGRVEICLDGLPAGVTAIPVAILWESASATLRIQTTADARPGRSTVKLVTLAEGQKTDERAIALTVEKAAPEPREKKSEAKSERVLFSTVDHAQIAGTLYPGSKGKKGACILMLHELDKDRSAASWRRLAEALQADGHTVLTFDFRGHGESKHVSQDFWQSPVNRRLPEYSKGAPTDGLPETIAAESFPAAYLPWMIHDIAAARAFLDLRHEDPYGPVNSFNLTLFGVGRGAMLGSLWLATEGFRYESTLDGKRPEIIGNRDIARAIWLDIQTQWKGHSFPVAKWMLLANRPHPDDRVVPIDFIPILGAHSSGWEFLETNAAGGKQLHGMLKNALKAHPFRDWSPRQFKVRRSYWHLPTTPKGPLGLFLAKKRGEQRLHPVPLESFDLRIDGLHPQRPVTPDTDN
jgi:pimeloyl-ACP methyl ester carboxylesterase